MDAPCNWLIDEACGGHGAPVAPAPFDVRGCIVELLAVPQPMFYDWSSGGLKRARRAMAEIDAKIEEQKIVEAWKGERGIQGLGPRRHAGKAYGRHISKITAGDPELFRAWRNGTWSP